MFGLLLIAGIFIGLIWLGVKLKRWANGSSKIAKNQEKILEEIKRQNNRKE